MARIAARIVAFAACLFVFSFSAAALAQSGSSAGPSGKVVLQQWELSCGAAALATILTWQQGDPVTEREVVTGLLKITSLARVDERHGFSLLDLKRYAEGRGYLAEGYGELAMDDLVRLGPAIVRIRVPGARHFVVFRGVHEDWVLIGDPARGTRLMRVEAFEHVWLERQAFVLRRADGAMPPDELAATPADFAALSPAADSAARGAGGLSGRAAGPRQP